MSAGKTSNKGRIRGKQPPGNQSRGQKKTGGFHAFGLSLPVFKGITAKGYMAPTPIQRKTIPTILSGRDVVAMSRTGSGKTAAFVLPMLEKLQKHSGLGPRALILSPTRELAQQTCSFITQLGKYSNLVVAVLTGSDNMEDQFKAIHFGPDIIVATPGRLLHILVEMKQVRLKTIDYVVFDEGDRLFEEGFADQLGDILRHLPETRQTLIFSATLPRHLVEFALAGLTDPLLVRLDVDNKLSQLLKLIHLSCIEDEKVAALLILLCKLIPRNQKTVVFLPTKHHVDYTEELLNDFGLRCTVAYNGMDAEARQQNMRTFRGSGGVNVMLMTDLGARGIDIPHLDNVVNFNFPAQPKLFVHRVGRVARAGRTGTAYSLVAHDEWPHLVDLNLFTNRGPLKLATRDDATKDESDLIGQLPRDLVAWATGEVARLHGLNADLDKRMGVCLNAMKNERRHRLAASVASVRLVKGMTDRILTAAVHPTLRGLSSESAEHEAIMNQLRLYRSPTTVFDCLGRKSDPKALAMMTAKREQHDKAIRRYHEAKSDALEAPPAPAPRQGQSSGVFVPLRRPDEASESGLSVGRQGNFLMDARSVQLDIRGDDASIGRANPIGSKRKHWDRKRLKFVGESGERDAKMIRTESGAYIPASYRTGRYERWLKQHKVPVSGDQETMANVVEFHDDEGQGADGAPNRAGITVMGTRRRRNFHTKTRTDDGEAASSVRQPKGKRTYGQLRKPEQMLKEKRRREKVQQFQRQRQTLNQKKARRKKGKK